MIVTLAYVPKPPINAPEGRLEIQAYVYWSSPGVQPERVTSGSDATGQVTVENTTRAGTVEVTGWNGIAYIVFGCAFTDGDGPLVEDIASATMTGEGQVANLVLAYPDAEVDSSVFLPVFDSRGFTLYPHGSRDFVRFRTSTLPTAVYASWNKGAY